MTEIGRGLVPYDPTVAVVWSVDEHGTRFVHFAKGTTATTPIRHRDLTTSLVKSVLTAVGATKPTPEETKDPVIEVK